MYVENHIRTCKIQHVIIAFHLPRNICEPFSTEVCFRKIIRLNHSPHRSVEDKDSVFYCFSHALNLIWQLSRIGKLPENIYIFTTFPQLEPLNRPVHLPPIFLLFQSLTLIKLFFPRARAMSIFALPLSSIKTSVGTMVNPTALVASCNLCISRFVSNNLRSRLASWFE